MANKIQFRRGTTAQRTAAVLDSGEPGWDTDEERLYVGDGATAGGVPVADAPGTAAAAVAAHVAHADPHPQYATAAEAAAAAPVQSVNGMAGAVVVTASEIDYTAPGSGSVARTQAEKNAEIISVKDKGAVGDGVTDDTAAVAAFQASSGIGLIPPGSYATPSSPGAPTAPRIVIAGGAQRSGTPLPFIAIGKEGFNTLPQNYLFVQHDTSDRSDAKTVQIQRVVNTDVGATNPQALRVLVVKNHSNARTDWAISGEIESYSNTASDGDTAVSGVATKRGTASVSGGHFQANDYNLYSTATAVTPVIGAEINTPAVGLDHPTANAGFGNRRCLDIVARTNESVIGWNGGSGNAGHGEIGVGVDIRTDNLTRGYFRFGLAVREVAGNPSKINTAIYSNASGAYGLRLVGANTTAVISLEGNANLGIILSGTYTGPAIRVNAGQYIGMENTNAIKTAYGVSASVWGFYNGAAERVGFIMNASPGVRVAGTQVVGQRDTGWVAMTGTSNKGTTYDTSTITLAQLAGRVMAIQAALTQHGLIGP